MTTTIGGTAGITFPDASTQNTAATGFGFKNRIINGAMVISQAAAGASITLSTTTQFPVDRLNCFEDTDGTITAQQSSVAPAGFTKSTLFTVTVADASLGAAQRSMAQQRIEGYNVADFGWGAAGAATVTLSFWVRSSLTGSFGAAICNGDYNRSYPFTYTINAANTWEQKTVTITGDTSGTWLTTNGIGLSVLFNLGSGSNFQGTANAWQAGEYYFPSGTTQFVSNAAATFYITGVQLEKGSTATSFDYRPYGTELALCQRYFFKWENTTGSAVYAIVLQAFSSSAAFGKLIDFPVSMRSSPTITTSGSFYPHNSTGTSSIPFSSLASFNATPTSLGTGGWTGSAGLTAGNATGVGAANNSSLSMSAEL